MTDEPRSVTTRSMIRDATEGVVVFGQDGRVVALNAAAERLFGHPYRDVLGEDASFLFTTADGSAPPIAFVPRPDGPDSTLVFSPDILGRRKDGTTFSLDIQASHVKAEGRQRFLLVIQDLAVRIRQEEAARKAEEQMREAQELKLRTERLTAIGQIAASVSHDLRNPLGAIRNAWYYLQRRIAGTPVATADPRVEKFSVLIDRELARCANIIGDLLDFSRDRPPHRVACPLARLADDAIAVVARPTPDIKVLNEVPKDLPIPYLDIDQFRQMLVNLLQNAVEAVDPTEGRVWVRGRALGDDLELEVVDNGRGIPPGELGKIFEPLFTTKLRGTGLGLAIVTKIVRGHGGTVSVESTPGAGTTFRLRFPPGEEAGGPAPAQGGAADLKSS